MCRADRHIGRQRRAARIDHPLAAVGDAGGLGLAMGYFDYMDQPRAHLSKMIELADGRVFASFPKRREPRSPLRKLRFALARGFVRFYSRADVVDLYASAGRVPYLSIVDLGRDYIAIYDAGAARKAVR